MMTQRLVILWLGLLALPAFGQTAPVPAARPSRSPKRRSPASRSRPARAASSSRSRPSARRSAPAISCAMSIRSGSTGSPSTASSRSPDRFGFVQFGTNGDPKRALPPIKHEPTTLTGVQHLDGALSTPRLRARHGARRFHDHARRPAPVDGRRPGQARRQSGLCRVRPRGRGDGRGAQDLRRAGSPTGSIRGAFKGEIPVAPVRIVSARRVKP